MEDEKAELKKALDENKSTDDLKKLSEALQQTMYTISQKAYQQVQQESAQGQATGDAQSDNAASEDKKDDDVIDAEYTKE